MAYFWKSFKQVMGTQLIMSTSFHPQIDGQSKRNIQNLEDMLRACVLDLKGSLEEYLPFVDPTRSTCRRDSLLIEKIVDFRALENPSRVRNNFVWSRHLLFIFIFKNGENEVRTKTPH